VNGGPFPALDQVVTAAAVDEDSDHIDEPENEDDGSSERGDVQEVVVPDFEVAVAAMGVDIASIMCDESVEAGLFLEAYEEMKEAYLEAVEEQKRRFEGKAIDRLSKVFGLLVLIPHVNDRYEEKVASARDQCRQSIVETLGVYCDGVIELHGIHFGCAKHSSAGSDSALLRWYMFHSDHPYPTREEKERLALESGLEYRQVETWFINRRSRCKRKRGV